MKTSMTVIALSILLVGCGEDDSNAYIAPEPTPVPLYTPVFDLSGIPVTCADSNIEVVDPSAAGVTIPYDSVLYVYPSVGDGIGNACSPSGTDFPTFLMNDNLNNVLAYTQMVGDVAHHYQYIVWEMPMNLGASSEPTYGGNTPIYLESDDGNGTTVIIDMTNHTKTVSGTVYSDYTQEDFLAEYPKQLHQETALNLFKLSNNQKPSL